MMNEKNVKLYGTPKVGGDTLAYCTRCKMELSHVVVSMVDARPVRVLCKTCKGEHNFKLANPIASSTRKTRAKSTPKVVMKASALWEQRLAERHSADLVPYQTVKSFKKDDVLQHPSFGVEIDEEVKRGGKILVLFREGQQILIHEMGLVQSSPK